LVVFSRGYSCCCAPVDAQLGMIHLMNYNVCMDTVVEKLGDSAR